MPEAATPPQASIDEITLHHGDVSAKVAPGRGALVTSISVRDREMLYLDRASFQDVTKNVRGGIPVLFPYAGKLKNEDFLPAGTKMPQHGFGRNRSWTITEGTSSMLRMRLEPDNAIRSVYPYDFVVEQTCLVVAEGLQVEMMVLNRGAKPLPVSPGWHPYFRCAPKQKHEVASSELPQLTAEMFPDDKEFDFGLVAPQDGRAKFDVPELGLLRLSFNPRMRHLQFWSQPEKPFVCIEPFAGPANTVNTPQRIDVPPGEARTFWMRMQLED